MDLNENYVINSASTLFHVTGPSITDISGSLTSYGQFILTNPNGIHIFATGNVQGSVIFSTLNIQNQLYANNQLIFQKDPNSALGSILNEGTLTANEGGYIALLAEEIQNQGIIEAHLGSVALGSGIKQTISFDEQGLINLVVDEGLAQELQDNQPSIDNTGSVTTDGGKIIFSAKTFQDTMQTLINQDGLVKASRAVEKDGVIEFVSNGAIVNTGTIDTNFLKEEGYTFKTSGTLLSSEGRGRAFYHNIDGKALISGDIGIDQFDEGDLIVDGNITLIADDLIFAADTKDDGTPDTAAETKGKGVFSMNAFTTIDLDDHDLTIKSSANNEAGDASVSSLWYFVSSDSTETLTLDTAGINTPTYAVLDMFSLIDRDSLTINENVIFKQVDGFREELGELGKSLKYLSFQYFS